MRIDGERTNPLEVFHTLILFVSQGKERERFRRWVNEEETNLPDVEPDEIDALISYLHSFVDMALFAEKESMEHLERLLNNVAEDLPRNGARRARRIFIV